MKKTFIYALITALLLSACSKPPADGAPLRAAGLKGATTIGMVFLMDAAERGEAGGDYEFTIGSTDEIAAKISSGELDVAALPANLAAVLWNNTNGAVKVAAINTTSVLYVIENGGEIQSVADLKGRTVLSTGKGSTPEFAFNYVLKKNGLDPERDVNIEWKSEAAEILQTIAAKPDGDWVALVPQPFVTSAQSKVNSLRVALNLGEEWDKVSGGEGALTTGVVVVRSEFYGKRPDAVKAFLKEYEQSAGRVNADPAGAGVLTEKYGIVAAAVAEKAIPFCGIGYISGADMKTRLSGYLAALFSENPKSVGGTLPGDDFYILK